MAPRNEAAEDPATIEHERAPAGAPDFPIGPMDIEQLAAAELKVAKLARRSFRKEVQHGQSEAKFFEGRQELAMVKTDISKRRLKKAAKNVRAKEVAHQQAVLSAESEEEDGTLGRTPPSSPVPDEADVVDLTADEGEN